MPPRTVSTAPPPPSHRAAQEFARAPAALSSSPLLVSCRPGRRQHYPLTPEYALHTPFVTIGNPQLVSCCRTNTRCTAVATRIGRSKSSPGTVGGGLSCRAASQVARRSITQVALVQGHCDRVRSHQASVRMHHCALEGTV